MRSVRRARAAGGADPFLAAVAERHRRQAAGRPDPPERPVGTEVGPPDYVGVGVQKAGTTWWSGLLADHPLVDGGGRKELHFFQHGWDRPFDDADVAEYHRHFPRQPGHRAGEWTPRYLLDPWTPSRLHTAAPDARLLVLLRDPVARFRSGVTHSAVRHGTLHPRFLVEAIERGRYAHQLERLFRVFDRGQVLVLQLEACAADPAAELARTYRFLGLPDDHRPDRLHERVYGGRAPAVDLPADLHAVLVDTYAEDLARLPALVPDLDLDRWPTATA